MNFNNAIRQARKTAGLTQQKLATKSGISQEYLSRVETGRSIPTFQLVERIAQELKIPAYLLMYMGLEEEDIKPEKRKLLKVLKPFLDSFIKLLFVEGQNDSQKEDFLNEIQGLSSILTEEQMNTMYGGNKNKVRDSQYRVA